MRLLKKVKLLVNYSLNELNSFVCVLVELNSS